MKWLLSSFATLGTALVLAVVVAAPAGAGTAIMVATPAGGDVLSFDTAFANVSPFIGAAGAIRGVPAAPLPWSVRSIRGDLDSSGQLSVDVDGLVLANDPAVPANLRGTNPVPFFAAIVSCTSSSGGKVVIANRTTANFTATMPGGNAFIHQRLSLPHPCAAPDVFVTSPNGGVWFTITGSAGGQTTRDVQDFATAFANVSPFIGAAGAISGQTAAPLPWAVRAIHGDLDADGQLNISVRGLVLANDPAVPANLRGTNPVPFFAGVVTCRVPSGKTFTTTRVISRNFPATPGGNAEIHQRLTLPQPCVGPYVFVTSPNGGVWFAVTGQK
jgi:hypothetical protein